MNKLHEIYKLRLDDTRYRHKLKLRLNETFPEKIMFLQPNNRCPDVVIACDSIEEVLTTITHPQTCIKSAAATLRADILSYCNAIKDQNWPPTIETVTEEYGSPPDLVKLFLSTLLYSGKKSIDKLDAHPRLAESFCTDFVHAVSRGEVITSKHYLLSFGMHNMTGQKLLNQIVNELRHCISHPKTWNRNSSCRVVNKTVKGA